MGLKDSVNLGDVSGVVKIDASVSLTYFFTMVGDTTADMLNLVLNDQLNINATQDGKGNWALDFTADANVGTQIDLQAAQGPGLTSGYVFVRNAKEYTPLTNTANNVAMPPQEAYTSGSAIMVGADGPLPVDCSVLNSFLININNGEVPEPVFFGVAAGKPVFVVFVQPASGNGKVVWNTSGQMVDDLITTTLDVDTQAPSATGFVFVGIQYDDGVHLQLVSKT